MDDQPLQILDGQLTIFDELATSEPITLESGDLWAGAKADRPGARAPLAGGPGRAGQGATRSFSLGLRTGGSGDSSDAAAA
jgi:hypothetical protein